MTMENSGRPKYLQLADELRRRIASGDLPVGAELPSTSELSELWNASSTEVRAAVRELVSEDLVLGEPGKTVHVRAVPERAVRPSDDLRSELAHLQTTVDGLVARVAALEASKGTRRRP